MRCPAHRHGDKATEMRLLPFTDYIDAAERLAIDNPLTFKRMAFVSTEDQGVINDTVALTIRDTGAPYALNTGARPSLDRAHCGCHAVMTWD